MKQSQYPLGFFILSKLEGQNVIKYLYDAFCSDGIVYVRFIPNFVCILNNLLSLLPALYPIINANCHTKISCNKCRLQCFFKSINQGIGKLIYCFREAFKKKISEKSS